MGWEIRLRTLQPFLPPLGEGLQEEQVNTRKQELRDAEQHTSDNPNEVTWAPPWTSQEVSTNELPWRYSGEKPTCYLRRHRFHPWVRKIPWRRKWRPTPVSLPRKSRGERGLASYSPRGHKTVRHNLTTKQQRQQISLFMLSSSRLHFEYLSFAV